VVAITKVDAVDRDLVPLVATEITDLVAGTFLEGCPIVPVSSRTGEGIERLSAALVETAGRCRLDDREAPFRMPIDRAFSVAGHGTVVTGSVLAGEVRPGDALELLPAQRTVRVRGIQLHGRPMDGSRPRRRTALNLGGIKVDELARGHELATPGYLHPARRLLVRLVCLSSAPIALRDRWHAKLHLGTNEATARLIFEGGPLSPGAHGYAELRTDRPVTAAYGQRFILRRPSPALTVGGGVILDPGVESRRRLTDVSRSGKALDTADDLERLSLYLSGRDEVDRSPLSAAWKVGIPPESHSSLIDELETRGALVRITQGEPRRLVHRERLQALSTAVLRRIRSELRLQQPRHALPRRVLASACRPLADPALIDAALDSLLRGGQLVAVGANLGPADMQVRLTKNQSATRARILERIVGAGLMPPNLRELATDLEQEPEAIATLLALCVEEGALVEIDDGLYFPLGALEQARRICRAALESLGAATISQLREAWGVTRKYSFPLCLYLDARQVTVREGDLRRAGPRLNEALVPGK
jgi:selenocysteine-specific elongation factor